MVSLMQLTIAGFAAYMVAVFGMSANTNISLGWPWWIGVPLATLWGLLDRISTPPAYPAAVRLS